ncbi:MAG TPA: glycoside hydrolase family 6 protein, partial [Polyangia bacterium]|nr:glycoside hydrolase family 6 protein [Polyangia bacterium]
RFAIKFLRRDLAGRRDILVRFQREAQAAGALENENVAAAVDFGICEDGTPYIVMEFLAGESLAALVERERRLPSTRATDLIRQACHGMAAAHAAAIVHRDLKPHNLFVARRDDGTDLVKVLDFGVAKLQAIDDASAATRTGTVMGTAAYMAPEQARGDKTVDARADVYALGAILYELLSGERPHPGDSQNAILHHIATQAAVPIGSVEPDLPPGLAAVVDGALASDPAHRPASADALAGALASFARRQVWPPAPELPAAPAEPPLAGARRGDGRPRRTWSLLAGGVALIALLAGAALQGHRPPPPPPAPPAPVRGPRGLDPATQFFLGDRPPGATDQIETLRNSGRTHDAALLTQMLATPAGIWFTRGTPEQVRIDVADVVVRGGRAGLVPVLVTYNHPFLDCSGYGASGARDTAAYRAWIDGFAAGIGNERAIVILEPSSLGLVPYGVRLDGRKDECRPTAADASGNRVAAAGATPEERFTQISYAVDTLARHAPHALVYVDGTHSWWLPVPDMAYRLARVGVDRAAGFFLNAGNYQPTRRLVQYGTWVSKCLYRGGGRTTPDAYADCATQFDWMNLPDEAAWAKVDAWYVEHVDHGPHPPAGPDALTHFVINTNQNGQGPLDTSLYGRPPYDQPPDVVTKLRDGAWCMPPGRGLGARPTASTGLPLVDAFLWIDRAGVSVAPCDIAGRARAWDYARYNPWTIEGDPQKHFDPLWGRTLPPVGDWFPEEALALAKNADPPLLPTAERTSADVRTHHAAR